MRRPILLAFLIGIAAASAATPASACSKVTIFFDWNSARIAPDSRAALERFAVALAWKGPDLDQVLLTSHTDSSGSDAANRDIARRRAEAVRAVLLNYHVPASLIAISPLGEGRLRVPTGDNVRQQYNRRVELLMQMSADAQARQMAEGRPIC